MTRTMYDSTSPLNIPTTAAMVAGYIDHPLYTWSPAGWARFPNAVKVRIAVKASTNDGDVLDVENTDATPAQAPGWVTIRRAAGADPSVYCSASVWPTVKAAFVTAGVRQPHYWIACYDGVPSLVATCSGYPIAGAVAKQYADSLTSGGHYDLSIVADYWPGVDDMDVTKQMPLAICDITPGANVYYDQACAVIAYPNYKGAPNVPVYSFPPDKTTYPPYSNLGPAALKMLLPNGPGIGYVAADHCVNVRFNPSAALGNAVPAPTATVLPTGLYQVK